MSLRPVVRADRRDLAVPEACEWRLGEPGPDEVRVVERFQRDGSKRYAVTHLSYVANLECDWELEPIPSSRDEDFIARTRFTDWIEAVAIARRMLQKLEVE